jgi:flagellar motor protein MotB
MTDLMAGVAVTFLLIAAIFMVQATASRHRAEEAQRVAEVEKAKADVSARKYEELDRREHRAIDELKLLGDRLRNNAELHNRVQVDYDENKDPRLLTITFTHDELRFAAGECTVEPAQRAALDAILKQIFPRICETKSELVQSVSLEGHTDNSPPYGGKCGTVSAGDDSYCFAHPETPACKRESFENNVRLSSARAQYVFFEARNALEGDQVLADCLDRRFMIAGRGPIEPTDDKPWDASRTEAENQRNRRVAIKVRVTAGAVSEVSRP